MPILSPDGEHILFLHDARMHTLSEWDQVAELYMMDRDGGGRRLLERFRSTPEP